jgi:hypothetical protein
LSERVRVELLFETFSFAEFIVGCALEVGFNGMVLYRELQALRFGGGLLQVQRYVRCIATLRRWSELTTLRFETGPGEQVQVDYGQVWI